MKKKEEKIVDSSFKMKGGDFFFVKLAAFKTHSSFKKPFE